MSCFRNWNFEHPSVLPSVALVQLSVLFNNEVVMTRIIFIPSSHWHTDAECKTMRHEGLCLLFAAYLNLCLGCYASGHCRFYALRYVKFLCYGICNLSHFFNIDKWGGARFAVYILVLDSKDTQNTSETRFSASSSKRSRMSLSILLTKLLKHIYSMVSAGRFQQDVGFKNTQRSYLEI